MTKEWHRLVDPIFKNLPYTSPAYVFVAVAVLGASIVVVMGRPGRRSLDLVVERLASWLRTTGLLSDADIESELQRLNLLRVVLGLMVLDRFWPAFMIARAEGAVRSEVATAVGLALSGALAVGVATPVAGLLLAFSLNLVLDFFSVNQSIGSIVVAICLIPMVVAPVGYTVSLDVILARRFKRLGAPLRVMYNMWGPPNVDRIQVGRFLALVAYGTISAYSALMHLASPTWRSGAATGVLLLSPVSSPSWAPLAQYLYDRVNFAFVSFSLISTYGMLTWQLLLVPMALLSRWTRRFVIFWGILFFVFSTYILHLKTLGVYEFVLWALVFSNGSVSMRWFHSWRPVLRTNIELFAPSSDRGPVSQAIVVTFAVLWTAFVAACLPHLAPALAERSVRYFGRAPMVFGMSIIDVFNEADFRMYRNEAIAYQTYASGNRTSVPFSPPEGVEQAFTGRLQIDAYQALFCDPEFARLWFTTYAVTLPPSAPARRLPFEMEFTSWTRPTNHELASFRHEKIAWETMCVVRIDLQQPDRPSVRYYPAAVPRLVSAGIDYPPELDRINLAGRFPCAPEAEAAASWYNRPGVHRTKEDQMALEELFAGEQSGGPAQCLVGYKHLIARLDADDHAPLYVNPEATCDSELAIAASYDRVLTNYGPLHATIAAALASTRAAAARGDEGACRQAVADIRSTFIGAVYGTDRRD